MSSARARRTFVPSASAPANTNTTATATTQQSNTVNTPGLTLPQVISLIDTRLVTLETFMKDTRTNPTRDVTTNNDATNETQNSDMFQEFNQRFEILTEEINTVKDLLLKLQSYTMDVNKALYEERIHVFSGMCTSSMNTPEEQIVGADYNNETDETITENIISALADLAINEA